MYVVILFSLKSNFYRQKNSKKKYCIKFKSSNSFNLKLTENDKILTII